MPIVIGLSLSHPNAMSSSFLHTTHTNLYYFSPRLRCAVVVNVLCYTLYALCCMLCTVPRSTRKTRKRSGRTLMTLVTVTSRRPTTRFLAASAAKQTTLSNYGE